MAAEKCAFCRRGYDVEDQCGTLFSHVEENCYAHKKCMQYSAKLVQYKHAFGFGGFKIKKVLEEKQRGRHLKCHLCRTSKKWRKVGGATAGCAIKTCRRTFHYFCAKKDSDVVTVRLEVMNSETNKKLVLYRVFCNKEHQEMYYEAVIDDKHYIKNTGGRSDTTDSDEEDEDQEDEDSSSSSEWMETASVPSSQDVSSTKTHDQGTAMPGSKGSPASHTDTKKSPVKKHPKGAFLNSVKKDGKDGAERSGSSSGPSPSGSRRLQLQRKARSQLQVNLGKKLKTKGADSDSGHSSSSSCSSSSSPSPSLLTASAADPLAHHKQSPIKREQRSASPRKAKPDMKHGKTKKHASDADEGLARSRKPKRCREQDEDDEEEESRRGKRQVRPMIQQRKKKSSNVAQRDPHHKSDEEDDGGVCSQSSRGDTAASEDESSLSSSSSRSTTQSKSRTSLTMNGSTFQTIGELTPLAATCSTGLDSGPRDSSKPASANSNRKLSRKAGGLAENDLLSSRVADPHKDVVLCFCEKSQDEQVVRKMTSEAMQYFQVPMASVCIWQCPIQLVDNALIYVVTDISKALQEKNLDKLQELLLELKEGNIDYYNLKVQFNRDFEQDFQRIIHKQQRKLLRQHFERASESFAPGLRVGYVSDKTDTAYIKLCESTDPDCKIRSQLNVVIPKDAQLFQWSTDTRVTLKGPGEQAARVRQVEYENLKRWMKPQLQEAHQIFRYPSDAFLLSGAPMSVTNRLSQHFLEQLESLASPSGHQATQCAVFVGPVDRSIVRPLPYTRRCLLKVLEQKLTARSTVLCVFDLVDLVEELAEDDDSQAAVSYDDVISVLPKHCKVKMWSAYEPDSIPVTCVLLQCIMAGGMEDMSQSTEETQK